MTDEEIITAARQKYAQGSSDNLEIDDTPSLSRADNGTWVSAWVWVPHTDDVDARLEENHENRIF